MNIYEYQFNRNKQKLYQVLKNAKENIPYYQEVLNKDIDYYLEDFSRWLNIPLLEKSIIQENPSKFFSCQASITDKELKYSCTSGSTGIPLKVYKSQQSEFQFTKKLWSLRKDWQKDIHKWKLLYLYRNVEDIYRNNVIRLGSNDDYLELSDQSIKAYCEQIIRHEPKWLIGPPIITSRIANVILDYGIKIESIEYAELYGEMLMPHHIDVIEKAFGCKTINLYGAREFNVLSYECPCGTMHALDDYYLFEIYEKGDGESLSGELVVTSLTNMMMPLIRYKIGDICLLKYNEKACSLNESMLSLIPKMGRVSELIKTETNVMSSGTIDTIFSGFIDKYPASIKQYQVVQNTINSFDVYLIIGSNYNSIIENEIKKQLIHVIGNENYKFKYVQHIMHDPSLKSKSFIPMNK